MLAYAMKIQVPAKPFRYHRKVAHIIMVKMPIAFCIRWPGHHVIRDTAISHAVSQPVVSMVTHLK